MGFMSPMSIIDRQSKASSGFAFCLTITNKVNLLVNGVLFLQAPEHLSPFPKACMNFSWQVPKIHIVLMKVPVFCTLQLPQEWFKQPFVHWKHNLCPANPYCHLVIHCILTWFSLLIKGNCSSCLVSTLFWSLYVYLCALSTWLEQAGTKEHSSYEILVFRLVKTLPLTRVSVTCVGCQFKKEGRGTFKMMVFVFPSNLCMW